MSKLRRGSPILRKLNIAALAGAAFTGFIALPASAQLSPGETGYKRELMGKFAINFVNVQAQYGSNLIAGALETALKRSRDTVRTESKPVPEEVIKALTPFYKRETFEGVRYAVGDISPSGLAGFAIRNGNAAAVTLVDTIVFKDEDYVKNLALWSHEMHHIEQYKEWGVTGFAARYAFGWTQVEETAEAKAREFVAWYRDHN
jgi:Domain of unknown function (DUF4157)